MCTSTNPTAKDVVSFGNERIRSIGFEAEIWEGLRPQLDPSRFFSRQRGVLRTYRLEVHHSLFDSGFTFLRISVHRIGLEDVVGTDFIYDIGIPITPVFGEVLRDNFFVFLFRRRHFVKLVGSFTEEVDDLRVFNRQRPRGPALKNRIRGIHLNE